MYIRIFLTIYMYNLRYHGTVSQNRFARWAPKRHKWSPASTYKAYTCAVIPNSVTRIYEENKFTVIRNRLHTATGRRWILVPINTQHKRTDRYRYHRTRYRNPSWSITSYRWSTLSGAHVRITRWHITLKASDEYIIFNCTGVKSHY